MGIKEFADNQTSIETPNDSSIVEKTLNSDQTTSKRVDINVLKSKLQATQNKQFRKNIFILSSLIVGLGFLGIFFSL